MHLVSMIQKLLPFHDLLLKLITHKRPASEIFTVVGFLRLSQTSPSVEIKNIK